MAEIANGKEEKLALKVFSSVATSFCMLRDYQEARGMR